MYRVLHVLVYLLASLGDGFCDYVGPLSSPVSCGKEHVCSFFYLAQLRFLTFLEHLKRVVLKVFRKVQLLVMDGRRTCTGCSSRGEQLCQSCAFAVILRRMSRL